jgi:hypothetical protein
VTLVTVSAFTTDATGKPVLKPVIVGGPSKLCAPISKYVMVGSSLLIYPALHPTLHLVCFRITEPNATPPVTVKTDNQFNPAGQQRILTTVANPTTGQTATSLCLPSPRSWSPHQRGHRTTRRSLGTSGVQGEGCLRLRRGSERIALAGGNSDTGG